MAYTVTAAFKAAVLESHTSALVVEVWSGSSYLDTISVSGGTVDIDRTAAWRRTCRLTLVDPDLTLVPSTPGGLLAPFGNELHISRGVTFPDGSTELVPLGVFRIATTTIDDTPDGLTVAIAGFDRSRTVARAGFTDYYATGAGTDVPTAISNLLISRAPNVPISAVWTASTTTTPAVAYGPGDDPWAKALELAASIGAELYINRSGEAVLQPEADYSIATPNWTFADDGTAPATRLTRAWSDDGVYSRVIVTSASGSPVRGEAADTDPSSPTYASGPFGDVPLVVRSSVVASATQAADAAMARLALVKGAADTPDLDIIPNPAIDVGDLISIRRPRAGLDGAYIVDALTMPLEPSSTMRLKLRRR